jgi:hypothetical protein
MPYFHNDIINILFIHINKTGGTSFEQYMSYKFNIYLNPKSLYGSQPWRNSIDAPLTDEEIKVRSVIPEFSRLQHLTYQQILAGPKYFNINYTNITYITIVRNPYERIISGLFYDKLIKVDTTPDDVFIILKRFLMTQPDKNIAKPQYLFITDENGKLIPNLKILHTETLQADMVTLGYTDFDTNLNCNPHKVHYYKLLNNYSINLINDFYDVDFTMFNYKKYKQKITPLYSYMEKTLRIFDKFFDDALYSECYEYSISKVGSPEISFRTNYIWEPGIVKDSNLVLIHDLNTDNVLYKKISDIIKTKCQIDTIKTIMFYYWTPGSHIPWHTDGNHNGGITIYLNKSWDEDWGGIFLYKDGDLISGLYPKQNRCVMQHGGIPHSVAPTTKNSDVRLTIQIFF